MYGTLINPVTHDFLAPSLQILLQAHTGVLTRPPWPTTRMPVGVPLGVYLILLALLIPVCRSEKCYAACQWLLIGTTQLLLASEAFNAYKDAIGAVLDDENTGLLSINPDQFHKLLNLTFTISGVSI